MEYLYIPGAVVLVLGAIFLLNVLTNDWKSWAYAWILILSALGTGVVMCNRRGRWPETYSLIGSVMMLAGALFFIAFGALTGGLFIQIAAPLLLIVGGIYLYRLNQKGDILARFTRNMQEANGSSAKHYPNNSDSNKAVEALTEREMQVLLLIDQGLSNAEIAERLSIAPSTIKTHINNIFSKLGVQSRIRAIRQARSMGLIKSSTRQI
ncbi:MAG: response regulator transcription factor [Anaerolineaceae bacterium]|nr:response regulator transcription factor [Anaerolineaceae bacterium]